MLLFGLLSGSAGAFSPSPAQASLLNLNSTQIIVQLVPGANISLLNTVLGTPLIKALSLDRTYVITLPLSLGVDRILNLLNLSPLVEFAEPNYKLYSTEAQQAFLYYDTGSGVQGGVAGVSAAKNQWAWDKIDLPQSQTLSKGDGVTVAVLDTGVNTNHPAIKNQLVPGYNATAVLLGLLGGGNISNVNDENGHGTFVAGIVAQVAPDASIMPVKVLNNKGEGTVADVAEGMYWAVNHNARVVNLSLGLYTNSKLLAQTVKYAQDNGSLVVSSAGNSDTAEKRYPAAYPGVIGVASTDKDNHKAAFSNFGDNVKISAPGVKIYSAYYTGGYGFGDGTSFSAPQVAGLAAQLWHEAPDKSAGDVTTTMLGAATSLGSDDPRYGSQLGSGLLNNFKALQGGTRPDPQTGPQPES